MELEAKHDEIAKAGQDLAIKRLYCFFSTVLYLVVLLTFFSGSCGTHLIINFLYKRFCTLFGRVLTDLLKLIACFLLFCFQLQWQDW